MPRENDLVSFPDTTTLALIVYVYEDGKELGLNPTWNTSFVEILCGDGDIEIHDIETFEVISEGR